MNGRLVGSSAEWPAADTQQGDSESREGAGLGSRQQAGRHSGPVDWVRRKCR